MASDEKACKNCHLITKKDKSMCPKCKTHTLSDDFSGEVLLIQKLQGT